MNPSIEKRVVAQVLFAILYIVREIFTHRSCPDKTAVSVIAKPLIVKANGHDHMAYSFEDRSVAFV